MKIVLLLWCFVVNVNILLTRTFSLEDYLLDEGNIITKCSENILSDGGQNLTVYPTEKCKLYKIRLTSLNESSTFKLSAEIRSNQPSEQIESTSNAFNGTLEVQIYERVQQNGGLHNVLRATWNEAENLNNQKYFSYNTAVLIEIVFTGNWAHKHLVIFSEEILIQNCTQNITVDGGRTLNLYPTVKCDSYEIRLFSWSESSIFNLTAEIQSREPSDQNEIISDAVNGSLEVQIYETVQQNGSNDVLRETWNETESLSKQKYLSRNSEVLIKVTFSDDWTDNQVIIFSEEIKHRVCMLNISEKTKHKFSEQLTPNLVDLYLLQGGSSKDSIEITLHELLINTTVGDYLLIGSGIEPFEDHPPLFVMKAKPHSKFYVVDGSAYVAFVTGPSVAKRSINISWEHTVKKTDDENPTEDPTGVLNSTEICFYNVEAALSELENSEKGRCSNFRTEFFEEARNYTIRDITEDTLQKKFENLNCSSVVLQSLENKPNSSMLYARIQVKSDGKSLLTWKHLENIIEEFRKNNYSSVQQLQIRSCPRKKDDWSYVIYFSIPVFAVFFLTIWAYQQKVFQQQCTPKKDLQANTESFRAEPNPYGITPRVYQEDEFGRRQTLVQENVFHTQVKERIQNGIQSTTNAEQRSPIEIGMAEMSEIPSAPRGTGSSRRIPNFTRSKKRPSIQSLIDQIDQSEEGSSAGRNEITEDHVYDSLSSRAEELETQL